MRRGSLFFTIFLMSLVLLGSCSKNSDNNKENDAKETMKKYIVEVDPVLHGSISIEPDISSGESYDAGTEIVITAKPREGYCLDSIYYAVQGKYGLMYHESMNEEYRLVINENMNIGASFISKEELLGFTVLQDIEYAAPGSKTLKYDIYKPDGAENLPFAIIIHGGGFTSNDENIMRGLAREIVRTGRYVVASIDYRWLGDNDSEDEDNTMADLIDDVFGAILHITEHSDQYGGNPDVIVITGDSAGGCLSACAGNMCNRLGSNGFGKNDGVYEFMPSYLPAGMTAEDSGNYLCNAIKAVAPSYGVFTVERIGNYIANYSDEAKAAIAPITNIPDISERAIPQFLLRGTKDPIIADDMVQSYVDALRAAGQSAEYITVNGASHAFFDWKPDTVTKSTFKKFGKPYAEKMIAFFDSELGL